MGKIKEVVVSQDEFEKLGKELLKHKYLYYVKSAPIISDYDYDMMERKYTKMAKELTERPEVSLISDWDELEWLSNATIVDFPENHPWADGIIKEVEGEKYERSGKG